MDIVPNNPFLLEAVLKHCVGKYGLDVAQNFCCKCLNPEKVLISIEEDGCTTAEGDAVVFENKPPASKQVEGVLLFRGMRSLAFPARCLKWEAANDGWQHSSRKRKFRDQPKRKGT